MDTETSSFDTSEIVANFISSTPVLPHSWRFCDLANAHCPQSFHIEQVGNIGYVAFSGVQSVPGSMEPGNYKNFVPLACCCPDDRRQIFAPSLLRQNEGEEPVMVDAGLLQNFLSIFGNINFQTQMSTLLQESKSIVMTGHSLGGATASFAALWLLSALQLQFSDKSVFCITYGSPLLANQSLSHAILRERWGGNFCHVVSRHDIVPRLLFAPQLHSLFHFWHLSMPSPNFGLPAVRLEEARKAEIFSTVSVCLQELARAGEGEMKSLFWPFGNYFLCSIDGAICVDNASSVIRMMYLLFTTSSPDLSFEDHFKYGDYVCKVSNQFLEKRSSILGELTESNYESSLVFALQSSGIGFQELIANPAKDCLKAARRIGRTPNLNCANLSIKLASITPYRAEIEWYKASCDQSDEQLGYYDSFKQRGASRRGARVNMNRHKLAQFWDNVIRMLDTNQLPYDFLKRDKWVNASQFYMLLVEPLDIAEYYRTEMHRVKGHYISHGRERRHQIFDRWWRERHENEVKDIKRSRFAGLTQDTCFWAKVEEAKELLDNVKCENDPSKANLLWKVLDEFERYASGLVERKEVSQDVVAIHSSYSKWMEEYKELKHSGFMEEEVTL